MARLKFSNVRLNFDETIFGGSRHSELELIRTYTCLDLEIHSSDTEIHLSEVLDQLLPLLYPLLEI